MQGGTQEVIASALCERAHRLWDVFCGGHHSRVVANLVTGLTASRGYSGCSLCDELERTIGMGGFACSSVVCAVIIGLMYDDPRQCLIDIANRRLPGGDLDSVASMAGGICNGLASRDGVSDWKAVVEERNGVSFREYAKKLVLVKRRCVR